MLKNKLFIGVLVLTISGAAAQSQQQMGPKETGGTVGGALIGGVLGSALGGSGAGRIVGGVAGAAVGGFIGNRIGASLDEEDRRAMSRSTRSAMTSGSSSQFTNKKTGVRGTAKVIGNSRNASGQACRTVAQEVVLKDGSVVRDQVTGCKGPNGWAV
jgi:surface antigen